MAQRNNFKSGSCEMLILFILKKHGDCYGSELSQLIKKSSDGKIAFPEGSLYPALYRLIDRNLISDYKVKIGKRQQAVYYHLESAGEERLENYLKEYRETTIAINNILDYDFSALKK